VKVIPDDKPIGLPVAVPSFLTYVAVAPPDTLNAPAYAETDAREPHNADNPILDILFMCPP
jgi:hypothetical protein